MIIPKIDGGTPTIVYQSDNGNDYLPVSVYASLFGESNIQTPISAIPKEEAGTGEIDNIITEYNKSLISLDIQGTSYLGESPSPENIQPIENANNDGMSVAIHGTNLATAQQFFKGFSSYREQTYQERNAIRFRSNWVVENVIEGGFKENTRYIISGLYNSSLREGTGDDLFLTVFYTDDTRENFIIGRPSEWTKKVFTTKANKTVSAIGSNNNSYMTYGYVDIDTFQVNEGTEVLPYEPYFRISVNVPSELDSTSAPGIIDFHNRLLLSKYDKLSIGFLPTADGYPSGTYLQGSYFRIFDGSEYFQLRENVFGKTYFFRPYDFDGEVDIGTVYGCNQFKNGLPSGGEYIISTSYDEYDQFTGILFKTDGEMSVDAFKSWLTEQYRNGTPVEVLCGRRTSAKKTIPILSIAQGFLDNLDIKRTYKNILEVDSNINAPQTPINLKYYIWGGRNENNSNT